MTWRPPEEEQEKLLLLRGTPIDKTRPEEKSPWRRFLHWVFPWLGEKRELADALMRAKVRQEVLKAEQQAADVEKTKAQTAEIYARMDIEKAKAIMDLNAEAGARLAEEMEAELKDKIATLRFKFGGRFEILDSLAKGG